MKMNNMNKFRITTMTVLLALFSTISIHAQDIGKTLPDTIMQQDSVESNLLRSQETNFTDPPTFSEKVIYPSPSSSVFKKYTGSQPSLSTGTINIPISLYELKYRDITIPFTLRYSTSGIKVFDESYPTGLGWTLTPGLRLTRQIMNRPDEKFRRISYNTNTTLVYDSLFLSSILIDGNHSQYQDVDYVDSQHDIFTLHLIDNSYNFVFEKNADGTYTGVGTELSGLKITADTAFSKFTVIDNSGIIYNFGGVKEYKDLTKYTTAWMLDSITLVNGDVARFTWEKFYHSSSQEISSSVLYDNFNGVLPIMHHETYISDQSFRNTAMTEPHAHLTEIHLPACSISFSYSVGDPQGRYPLLESMRVINSENKTVKNIEFSYDSISPSYQFLESVQISDEGIYTFDYNKVYIPYNDYDAQDWWGFYNGMTQNTSRVPKVEIWKYPPNPNGDMEQVGNGDRSVSPSHM